MNAELIKYIHNVLLLRNRFSAVSNIKQGSEIMKIWARWIITHRSLCVQDNLFLPDDEVFDSQLIVELQDKGVSLDYSIFLHGWLIQQCAIVNKNYNPVATVEFGGVHGDIPIKLYTCKNKIKLHCDLTKGIVPLFGAGLELDQVLPINVYNRMSRNYTGIRSHKNTYIWLCSTMYSLLDGKGLQWAVPPNVMSLLQSGFGCYTELFASPLNTYNRNYYSLFPLDNVFGSKGNFFTAPDSNFKSGAYEINPPFIDQLFTKTSERVLRLLDKADHDGNELTFIYVMPEWRDFTTYNMIAESRFCVKRIHLRSGQHRYYQYCTGTYIPARFGSYMFFLSTNSSVCSNTMENSIRNAFS